MPRRQKAEGRNKAARRNSAKFWTPPVFWRFVKQRWFGCKAANGCRTPRRCARIVRPSFSISWFSWLFNFGFYRSKRLDDSFMAHGKKFSVAEVLQFNGHVLATRQIARRARGRVGSRGVNLTAINHRDEFGSIRRGGDGYPILTAAARRPRHARIGGGVNLTVLNHRDEFGAIRRGGDGSPRPAAAARRPRHARIGGGVNLTASNPPQRVWFHPPRRQRTPIAGCWRAPSTLRPNRSRCKFDRRKPPR